MFSALVSGSRGPGSSTGRGHCVLFLGRAHYSQSLSTHVYKRVLATGWICVRRSLILLLQALLSVNWSASHQLGFSISLQFYLQYLILDLFLHNKNSSVKYDDT